MAMIQSDDEDDMIFMGLELTLKEVKKRLGVKDPPTPYVKQSCSVGFRNSPPRDPEEDINESVTIIETHSTPNILSSCNALTKIRKPVSTPSLDVINGDWDIRPDDSFLRIEKLVSEMCLSSEKKDDPEVAANDQGSSQPEPSEELTEHPLICIDLTDSIDHQNLQTPKSTSNKQTPKKFIQKPSINFMSKSPRTPASNYTTPAKNADILDYSTPLSELKTRTPIFKTPGNPVSQKKPGSLTKRCFNNVLSPVASYIKSTPSVPVINTVVPKRPLLGASSIPKPVRSIPKPSVVNKENIKLPSIAYKCAKETKLITTPDKSKLPHSQFAKQVVSTIPRATVIRHDHREGNSNKKPLTLAEQQNNSYADLSLHQADVSIAIQKSATKLPKPRLLK